MKKLNHCRNCNKGVVAVRKEWNWVAFFLFFGMGYVVYRFLFSKKNRCPICGDKV